jgi:hypothetical protein
MFGGSKWLFSACATLGATMGQQELPMSQAAQAHRVMAAGEHVGKILLLPTRPRGLKRPAGGTD